MTPVEILLLAVAGVVAAVIARMVRLPMWPLTGAIVGGAGASWLMGNGALVLPDWWSVCAQVCIGAAVGSGIAKGVFQEFVSMLAPGLVVVLAIIGAGVGAGLVIGQTGEVGHVVATLGTVPGGVGEMVAAAQALDVDSGLVATMHVVRLVLVLLSVPVLVTWAGKYETHRAGRDEQDRR